MTKRKLWPALSIPALLAVAACPADSPGTEPAETEMTSSDPVPDPEVAVADVAAGAAFYAENACADCHVEGVDDPFATPGLRGLDADALLAFMDGTAPHSGETVDSVTAENAANLAAFLATQ